MQSGCATASSGMLNPTPTTAAKALAVVSIDLLSIVLTSSDFAQSCEDGLCTLFEDVENAFALQTESNSIVLNNFIVCKLQLVADFDILSEQS